MSNIEYLKREKENILLAHSVGAIPPDIAWRLYREVSNKIESILNNRDE